MSKNKLDNKSRIKVLSNKEINLFDNSYYLIYLFFIFIFTLSFTSAFNFPTTENNFYSYTGNLTNLSEMQDVTISGQQDGWVLTWSSSLNKWIAQSVGSALSPWTQLGNIIYYNTGNVGIGTISPQNTFNVIGEINTTENIYQNESQVLTNKYTGWVKYIDTEYNTSNRFTANTSKVLLPNNGLSVREQEKPIDVDTFYNGTHLLARQAGDGILLRIRFDSEPQDNNLYCEITNDIGIASELKVRNINFPKGIGVEEIQSFTNFEYQLDSWYQNGGQLYIECSGDVEIWNIEYTIDLVHRGRGTY